MNRAKHYDPILFGLTALVTLLGLLFILDAGYARSLAEGRGYLPKEFTQQLMFLGFSGVAYWIVARFHAERWLKAAGIIWFLSLASLIAVEVVGTTMNGATRWLALGPIKIQPAEFVKLSTVLYLAAYFATRPALTTEKYRDWGAYLDANFGAIVRRYMPSIWVGLAFYLIEKEPDLGTGAMVAVIAFTMFFAGGISKRSIAICVGIALMGILFTIYKQPYRLDRITNHADRWSLRNVDDIGFQTVQSELGMANGALVGVGPGAGRSKHVMPATTTDFVMATVGEEFGLLGCLLVLGLIGGLVWRTMYLAAKADSQFKMLVLYGVAAWIGIQTCVNMMMANGFLPAIGIPLPFISSGGSSLFALWMAIGICQAMLLPVPVKEERRAPSRYRWGNGGARVSRPRSGQAGTRPGGGAQVPRVVARPRR
ncbi:MAG: FtsW/RodA/SpoVE family cell cycle protein [Fimbriimonas sp.]